MPSPFVGMDPYLEGYLWSDVHQALAYQCRKQLAPLVEPTYAVRLAVSMVHDRIPAHELGVVYPDVEIVRPSRMQQGNVAEAHTVATIAAAPLMIALPFPMQVRLVTVEIRDVAQNRLVTSIEILSPSNKREPGLSAYLAKQDDLRMAGVHLLEIDLLRRGTRPWPPDSLPATAYVATLVRERAIQAEVWPIGLRDRLPTLPVPLRPPDIDVPLDLQAALDTIYTEARYDLTIKYDSVAPEPGLRAEDVAWIRERVQMWRESAA